MDEINTKHHIKSMLIRLNFTSKSKWAYGPLFKKLDMTSGKEMVEIIDTENQIQLIECANKLDCSLDELFFCISKVGKSIKCIELYLSMNRDTIESYIQNTKIR
jgi:hypothetical protein